MRRLWCRIFGHEWWAVWKIGYPGTRLMRLNCHRCDADGPEIEAAIRDLGYPRHSDVAEVVKQCKAILEEIAPGRGKGETDGV